MPGRDGRPGLRPAVRPDRPGPDAGSAAGGLPTRSDPTTPTGRPIEDIARTPAVSAGSSSTPNDGRSAARIGAIRRSYDDVLAEGCAALGLAELLGVLPDGPELDAERQRVEVVLVGAGMVLEDTF